MTNPNPSPELREERTAWLRDRLLYAIQFHMWADATAAEVEDVIESLSDSDEYDPNVAALVQMPKWCSPCEAQQGVDSFFAAPPPTPAETVTVALPGAGEETCPVCEGKPMPLGAGCMAGCRDGIVLTTSGNVLRNMMFWFRVQEREIAELRVSSLATFAAANDEGRAK